MQAEGEHRTYGEFVERLEVFGLFLIASPDAAIVPHPSERLFNDIPRFSQPAPMGAATKGEQRPDHQSHDGRDEGGKTIAAVALKDFRFQDGAVAIDDRGNLADRVHGRLVIANVGGSRVNCERSPLCVDNYMAFAAIFRPIDRVGAGVDPPKSALTEALSITARFQSMPLAS